MMSENSRGLLEKLRRARGRVRVLKHDLLRLEKLQHRFPKNVDRPRWIEAKKKVLRGSEIFLLAAESLYEASRKFDRRGEKI